MRKRAPLLVYVPGGGFRERYDASPWVRRVAERRGFEFRAPDYPLSNPLGAYRRIRRVVAKAQRNGRDVYLYGESAGGTIAARLAEQGFGRAAAVNAPPSNLMRWKMPDAPNYWGEMRNGGPSTRRFLSPALHRSQSPILVQQSMTDSVVPGRMNARWARRDPKVRLRRYRGNHVAGTDLNAYLQNIRVALNYLDRQEGRRRR